MKHLEEYRDPGTARQLLDLIRRKVTRRWVLMEVCGGQTHSLLKYGISDALSDAVELIHGPGCPVCVTPAEDIDQACAVARLPNTVLFTFGDMLRVPGRSGSLQQAQTDGAAVRAVYSPLDAVRFAESHPEQEVVFFAVGFETTVPATAVALLNAAALQLPNFSLLVSHVRVQPAMEAIAADPHNRVQGFLAAGHVCTVIGFAGYQEFCERHQLPIVITGFEPLDLLSGILECVLLLECGASRVSNRYERCAAPNGNPHALTLVDRVFEPSDRPWRGIGTIASGGLVLRSEWSDFDARVRFPSAADGIAADSSANTCGECRAGEVLSGKIRPDECEAFGMSCTPESPLGAPMVSSEGACAAYFRYRRLQPEAEQPA